MRPSDALLRTFAAVPLHGRVLDAGCGTGRHLAALALLGFEATGVDCDGAALDAAHAAAPASEVVLADVTALPFPDAYFGWVIAFRLLSSLDAGAQAPLLRELRRVLAPGGWLYVAVETDAPPDALTALMTAEGLALAEAPVADFDADEARIVRGIYRRFEPGVVG
jgi:SAM-dependent methyltransferase